MAGTLLCCHVLQHVPYVKTMFSAVMALKGACSQAVHNKERCIALAEYVRVAAQPSLGAASRYGAELCERVGLCVSRSMRARACVSITTYCAHASPSFSLHRAQCGVSLCYTHETAPRCCRWLEGLCTVLNRIVDAHEKRGARHWYHCGE
jgi:hypothetical protein